jgi:hypothetical protein
MLVEVMTKSAAKSHSLEFFNLLDAISSKSYLSIEILQCLCVGPHREDARFFRVRHKVCFQEVFNEPSS